MKYRMRPAAIVLVATLLAAGCGGDDDDAAATTTTTQVETTTTTKSSTTTTTGLVRPELNNTVDDPVAAYLSIVETFDYLDLNPDPDLAGLMYEPGPLRDNSVNLASDLIANGWRWSEPSGTVEDVFLSRMVNPTLALVSLIERPNSSATLIDSSGTPVPDQPPLGTPHRVIVTLARDPIGAWLIRQIDVLSEVP